MSVFRYVDIEIASPQCFDFTLVLAIFIESFLPGVLQKRRRITKK